MKQANTKERKGTVIFLYYGIIGIILLAVHAFMETGTYDDAWFADMLNANTLPGYLIWRYREWSSRLPIEAAFVLFTHGNPWVWRIFDSLMILLLIYAISEVFVWDKNKQNYILPIFVLLALIPLGMLHSAGWVTTTICYIWPTALGLYSMIPLRKWFDGETPATHQYITIPLALIFATSQEQVAAIILCSYLLCGLALYQKRKKIQPFWWAVIAICILAVINIMVCPGNAIRNDITITNSFPEFADLGFGAKLYMGYVSTLSFFVSCEGFNLIFIALTGTLAAAILYKNQDLTKANIAIIPFLCTVILGLFTRVAFKNDWNLDFFWLKLFQNDRLQQFTVYNATHLTIECIVFAVILVCVLVEIYWVFEKSAACLLAYVLFFAGIASRMILGFTPSLYISAGRTAFFCCIAFLILTLLVVQECFKYKYSKWFAYAIGTFYVLLLAGTIYFEDFTHII